MVRENQLFVDLTDLRALLSSTLAFSPEIYLGKFGTHAQGTFGKRCEIWGEKHRSRSLSYVTMMTASDAIPPQDQLSHPRAHVRSTIIQILIVRLCQILTKIVKQLNLLSYSYQSRVTALWLFES